jgi:hypothetical protein
MAILQQPGMRMRTACGFVFDGKLSTAQNSRYTNEGFEFLLGSEGLVVEG